MSEEIVILKNIPSLHEALFIAGFDGWGNALNISQGMVDFLVRKFDLKPFARINPDNYYKFDENRPVVDIENGILKGFEPPGGYFYLLERDQTGRDIIILSANEPNLRWFQFTHNIITLCNQSGVKTIICLGSMYDNVLHTDTIFSTSASSEKLLSELNEKNIISINYKGPSAIHSTIHKEAIKQGFECINLWCHCPHYLQGTTHFGLLSHLGTLLASWGGFLLDTKELDIAWKDLHKQIQEIIEKNPELQGMINEIRKAKIRGSWDMSRKQDKIIKLEDFLKPK